jgi:hypothetical protein
MLARTTRFVTIDRHLLRSASFVLVSIVVLLASCKKATPVVNIDGVTGLTWQLGPMEAIQDPFITPGPAEWKLLLNNDQTFSFSLGSSNCTGRYSWTAMNQDSANVAFTISSWNTPAGAAATAEKLRSIVQSVRVCYLWKPPFIPLVISSFYAAVMVLEFRGPAGAFYVYR